MEKVNLQFFLVIEEVICEYCEKVEVSNDFCY